MQLQTIFGMSFFDFFGNEEGEYEWRVSPYFWLYWAVATPATIFTILVWCFWQRVNGLSGKMAR